jgi:hypothetical protein
MVRALAARVWLMKGSCRVRASTAEQLGSRIFAGGCVDDFRVQLSNSAKSSRLATVLSIQWLTQNILTGCGVIADVKPVDGSPVLDVLNTFA